MKMSFNIFCLYLLIQLHAWKIDEIDFCYYSDWRIQRQEISQRRNNLKLRKTFLGSERE
jgi:hypothetical protein